jgi:hypothetical protein
MCRKCNYPAGEEAREVCLSAAGTISAKAKLHQLCVAARATPPISISKVPAKI